MNHQVRDLKRGDCLSPTNPALLGNPLDFIHEEHLREREVCAILGSLAGGTAPDPAPVALALAFLGAELPLHLQDEEEDLFPLLRRRCEPDEEIGRAIARLSSDHRHAEAETPAVVAILAGLGAETRPATDAEAALLVRYAGQARRHLILENAIILPFARLRLTRQDLTTLSLRMMQRRGLGRRTETDDAH